MSRDSTRQLSPNFKVREFACKGSDVVLLDDELVVLLQCIREHLGKQCEAHFVDGTTLQGRAVALNDDASLTIEDQEGVLHRVSTADVGVLSK